jgi:hypothetical protein
VKSESGEEVTNENFINPLNVISFYWQEKAEGEKVLSIFLTNQYSVTFSEPVGQRFVEHMEGFLERMIGFQGPTAGAATRTKHARQAVDAVIEEGEEAGKATWEK